MATYTPQAIPVSGLLATYVAVGASDTFTPAVADRGKRHILHVKNGGGSPDSVVVDDPVSTSPPSATSFNPDVTVSVANATDKFIDIDLARFMNPTTGVVTLTHSFTTSVTAAVFVIG